MNPSIFDYFDKGVENGGECRNLRGAIFDLDGTLVDSMGVWHRIDDEFLGRRGFPADESYKQAVKTMKYETAAHYTIRRYGLSESPEEVMAEWDSMALHEYRYNIKCKPGAAEFLHYLKSKGVKLALATVSHRALLEAVLKGNDIFDLFDVLTDVSQVSRGKEEPDLYLFAAKQMKLEPRECMVFEDVLLGIDSAKRGGFYTCGVKDHSSEDEEMEIRRVADYFVESFNVSLY